MSCNMKHCFKFASIISFLLLHGSTNLPAQEFQIIDFPAAYFTYDKFNNGMFIKGSPLGKSGFIYFDLKSNETFYTFSHGIDLLPAMFNNSAKCIYNSQQDGFIRFILFDINTGEEEVIFETSGPVNQLKKNSVVESPFSISPDDRHLFYVTGWFFNIEDSTIIHSNPEFYMCGRDEPHSWKNNTTIIYASCGGTVSEYDLETVEINQIFDFPLEPEDEILTLDYNPVFEVVAFSVGKETLPPRVYIYDYKDDEFRLIYELERTIKDEILELAWSPDNLLLAFSWFADVDNSVDLVVYNIVLDSVTTYRDVTDELYDLEWISDDTLAYFSNFRIRGYSLIDTVTSVEHETNNDISPKPKVSVYPNPFNSSTNLEWQLPKAEHVKIEVFNILGQRVAELVNNKFEAGYHGVSFDASFLPSGVYIYTIKAGKFSTSRKMLLLK